MFCKGRAAYEDLLSIVIGAIRRLNTSLEHTDMKCYKCKESISIYPG